MLRTIIYENCNNEYMNSLNKNVFLYFVQSVHFFFTIIYRLNNINTFCILCVNHYLFSVPIPHCSLHKV